MIVPKNRFLAILVFFLTLLSNFWVKIRALMRPNLQRWTGFDLLIISGPETRGLNSDNFLFFKTSLVFSPSEAELAPFW